MRESSTEALTKAKLLNLEEKRQVHDSVYVHKALSGKLPVVICNQYKQQQSLKNYRSAEKQILRFPKHHTENYKNSPLYRSIVAWNNTPSDFKTADTTTTTFKQKVQAYYQRKAS